MQSFSRISHMCIVMLSSRTLHMTPRVQESRQEHNKDEPKYQPIEDEYVCSPTIPTYGKKTQVNNTAHSAISYFITWLSPPCTFACAWENTLIKVFVGSNDQQWCQTMTFRVLHYLHLVGYQLVSITSNFTHKRSFKMSTQHNVINRRTRLHSLDEKDSRSFTVFS